MTDRCNRCGSYAINHHCHGRDGSDGDLCDVCYWRKRAENIRNTTLKEAAINLENSLIGFYSNGAWTEGYLQATVDMCGIIRAMKE